MLPVFTWRTACGLRRNAATAAGLSEPGCSCMAGSLGDAAGSAGGAEGVLLLGRGPELPAPASQACRSRPRRTPLALLRSPDPADPLLRLLSRLRAWLTGDTASAAAASLLL